MEIIERFEAARPLLMSVAYRIVGSHHDAEDAVQAAWLRVQSADLADVVNLDGWLTTVTARLCLDQLRARERRGELPLLPEDVPGGRLGADEEFLRREEVSRALLVLLGELTPRQRVAYVLHDLFAVPFGEIAVVLDTTPASAKKLASRARTRLGDTRPTTPGPGPGPDPGSDPGLGTEHASIIEAFLAAARGGDIARLVSLMAPDAVRTVDRRLVPPGVPAEVRGATAVAEETHAFADRIAAAVPVLIDGRPGAVIAPGGHPYALIRLRIDARLVTRIDIAPYTPGTASLTLLA